MLTFMTATWLPATAVANAGLPPCELIVSIGPLKTPLWPMVNDCSAPGEFSFVALASTSSAPFT